MRCRSLARIVLALLMLGACGEAATAEPIFRALAFDGVDDYVAVPDPIALPDGPLTIEAWIWMSTSFEGGRIVSNRDLNNGYELDIYPADNDQLEVRLVFNGSVMLSGFFTGPPERWTHLAATWAGTTLETAKIYVDGDLNATGVGQGPVDPPTGSLTIGTTANYGFGYFSGVIDDVRIWSAALDQASIQAWMNKPVDATHPSYGDLEAYWKFDEGVGQAAVSLVNSPGRDGRLGSAAGDDGSDPAWTTNVSPVPSHPTTVGRIKWGFR